MPRLFSMVSGQGPELVLLHGWAMNSGIWQSLRPALEAGFRVTSIDLPGHGGSRMLANDSLDAWLNALAEVAPDRANWLGWSLGGMVALAFADRFPERVLSLLTVGANLQFVADGAWPWAMPAAQVQAFTQGVLTDAEATLKRFIALQFLGVEGVRETQRALQTAVLTDRPDSDGLLSGLRLLAEIRNQPRLKALTVPVKMIFGEYDRLVPVSAAAAIAHEMQNVEIQVIPAAGHAPFLSHRREFIRILQPFFSTHD